MMIRKRAQRLLEARDQAPERLKGSDFDAWFLPLVLDSLEPVQRDIIEWLVLGNPDDPLCTNDICVTSHTTAQRAGAALSDLRRLGLVETTHKTDEHGKQAYHIAVKWVRQAYQMTLQLDREKLRELMNTPLPPIYGRRSVRPVD